MKVAIPTFGDRVSPRFDCAQSVLVVNIEEGQLLERQELVASGWAPHERINRLVETGIDTVVCGGIDCWSAESLQSAGVTIYACVTGDLEEALAALALGELGPVARRMAPEPSGWCRRLPGCDSSQDIGQGRDRGNGRGRGHRSQRRSGTG